jgi:hypothetical protein
MFGKKRKETMSLRCDKYSLRTLIQNLQKECPGIKEAYLFGSRRHRTRSTRSDVDILLAVGAETSPEDIRDFALRECPALDFFILDGASATSCANGSKVKGSSKKNLIGRLDALLLWTAQKGFSSSDVDWEFEVIKGMNLMMTTLVTSEPFPSKAEAISSLPHPISENRDSNCWASLKDHPLWIVTGVAVASVTITFLVIQALRIVPLQERINELEKIKTPIVTQQIKPSEQAGGANSKPVGYSVGAR